MSFIEQAAKIFQKTAEFKFQAVMFGDDAFYIEGVRPIKIDKTEIIFKTYSTLITVTGNDFSVKEMFGDCVAVTGKLTSLSVRDL